MAATVGNPTGRPLLAGLGMGIVSALGWAISTNFPGGDLIAVALYVGSLAALFVAGAIGWRRGWVAGGVAGAFGSAIYAAYVLIGLSGALAGA